MTSIYVGNLAFTVTESDLRTAFEAFGSVKNVNIVTDRDTGNSRGFGFVDMNDAREAKNAIEGMNLAEIRDRKITVNEARPREQRGGGRR